MVDDIGTVYRDFNNINDPSSGDYEPEKARIRALLRSIRSLSGQAITKGTLAELTAITPPTENYMGIVLDDPDPTNNGYYSRVAAAWVWQRGFPDTFASLTLAGTANAQTATVGAGVNPADVLVYFATVSTDNTGPMTLSISGETARNVVNAAGNALSAGEWTGTVLFFLNSDGDYQLLLDAGAAAAAAQSATNAAASATAAAAFGAVNFDDVSDLLADNNDVIGYVGSGASVEVASGFRLSAQGFRYEVAASDATDAHIETAGGVKLYVLPGQTATNVLAFGLVADGVTDIGPQLQKAFDSDIPWLHFPAGTYKLNAVATCSRSIRLTGEPETVIDCSGGAYAILVQGSWTQISDLASDVARYVDRFPLTSTTGIEPGDILVISDPTPSAWFGAAVGRDYRKGEMCHVFRVDGTDVVIFGQTADSYEASKCDVYKLAPMEVEISDLYFIAGTSYALRVEMFTKYRDRNVGGVTTSDRVVNVYLGYDTIIETPATQNYAYPKGGTNYTHVISNLHKYKVLAASMGSSRHALAIGGGQYLPNRYGLIVGCSLECAENGGATGAADMHGCIEFTKYVDCEIRNVGNIAGANTTYQNCDIYSPVTTIAAYGSTIYGSEIAGGTLLIDGCTLHTEGDGNSFAYLNLAPLYQMREDLHIIVRDISIISYGGGGTSAQVIGVYRDGTVNTKKINVTVDGVSGYLPNGFQTVLRARNTDGSAFQSDFLIVDNVKLQAPAGAKYLIYPEASIASVPTREMEQRGKIIHTTNASSINAAADTPFKYRYSRIPAAVVGIGTSDGSVATGGLVAGKRPSPIVYSIDSDSIRPGMGSTDGAAFTAGVDVAISWSVGVFEV